jgi:hypothetical protein
MSERETKNIEIGGHKFEIKTYATAREGATIQQAYFKGTKVEVVGNEPKISEFNPNVQFDVQLELVRQMVVSMDGTAEDIVARCEALPNDVFDELATELDTLVAKKKN